ncbi:MAG: nicotinate-nucleotide--dimethylbenzimidazole phosphoribosyltransferase [Actinomycetota bacterium]|nr:nicotinate-nucleotide--dimethylbenzimidazole phosphoribosyltransferase [Actinomycetota bacterium]
MLKKTLKKIKPADKDFEAKARARLDTLTHPPGSLGKLEDIAARLAAIQRSAMPEFSGKKVIFTFSGDHGVTEEHVSVYPKEVTRQMVLNFIRGGAGINVLARHAGAEVIVVDMGVDAEFKELPGLINKKVLRGTKNMRKGPAMSREDAVRCIEAGIGLADEFSRKGYGLMGTGDMGIGNTTPSSAIACVLAGMPASKVTGKGTGISEKSLAAKCRVIEDAIALNRPDPTDPVDVLAKVGGAEIGGIAGLCIGAAANGVPVIVDGFISTAGALIAYALEPLTAQYMFSAHRSQEPGQKCMLDKMGLDPLLDLNMRLGEGTGAALAMHLIEAALKIYREMATFGEAGVIGEMNV